MEFVSHSLVTTTLKCQSALTFATATKRRLLNNSNAECNKMLLFRIRFCTLPSLASLLGEANYVVRVNT
jgi:hypothetical protein